MVVIQWMKHLYGKAEKNIQKWGLQDVETLLLAIMEELGELSQAFLKFKYEGEKIERIEEELDDLGALIIQLKMRLEKDKNEID